MIMSVGFLAQPGNYTRPSVAGQSANCCPYQAPVLVRLSTVISVLFARAAGNMAANQQLTGKAHQPLVTDC